MFLQTQVISTVRQIMASTEKTSGKSQSWHAGVAYVDDYRTSQDSYNQVTTIRGIEQAEGIQ